MFNYKSLHNISTSQTSALYIVLQIRKSFRLNSDLDTWILVWMATEDGCFYLWRSVSVLICANALGIRFVLGILKMVATPGPTFSLWFYASGKVGHFLGEPLSTESAIYF